MARQLFGIYSFSILFVYGDSLGNLNRKLVYFPVTFSLSFSPLDFRLFSLEEITTNDYSKDGEGRRNVLRFRKELMNRINTSLLEKLSLRRLLGVGKKKK